MNKTQNPILPTIIADTEDFAVLYKPPRMHTVPETHTDNGDTLLDWYAGLFPPVMDLSGKKAGEGGLLHRLDFETQGLVLCAKTQSALDFLRTAQSAGNFVKEYSAIGQKAVSRDPSFPPPPAGGAPPVCVSREHVVREPFVIESYFRPFGPGRKQVRPVTDPRNKDHSGLYQTEVVNVDEQCAFTLRLKKGFRHQIRCHLAWIGFPIRNDPVYGESPADGFLALRAHRLSFPDPRSGKPCEYGIDRILP